MRKPLRVFAICSRVEDFWKDALSQGQDMCCMRCCQITFREMQETILVCDACQKALPKKKFDEQNLVIWRQGLNEAVLCRWCAGDKDKLLRQDMDLVFCRGCDQRVPEINFEEAKLAEWRLKDLMHLAECARCVVRKSGDACSGKKVKCQKCHAEKLLGDFPAVSLKQWLGGSRTEERWRCFECQFPKCSAKLDNDEVCGQRPLFPVPHNAIHEETYYCEACRFIRMATIV